MQTGVEEVAFRVRDLQPDLLVWTSSWTDTEVDTIRKIARTLNPTLDMYGLPEEIPDKESVDTILKRLRMKLPESAGDISSSGTGSTSTQTAPIPVQ